MVQTFKAILKEKKQLTNDVLLLSFQVPNDFFFKAGQFVSLMLKKDQVQKPRSYSILNPPSSIGKLDICMKIVKDGFASEIFTTMKENNEVNVKGPFGHFIFDETTRNEHCFIAGGTGIAPFYSMIKQYLDTGKKMKLIFGEKTQNDLLFHDELLSLKANKNNFDYEAILSRATWNGKTGRVQEILPENLENKTFYICGLKDLVLETKKLLLTKGVKSDNIKFERYS
jgi:ferredoxin-NADP reductase